MNVDLSDTNILVTGASRGIGKAIATTLGECGACVAVHYNRSAEPAAQLSELIGNGSFAVQADLADPDACISLFETVTARLGRLHVLVNNAGVALEARDDAPIAEWIAAWQATMDINLRAVGILSQLAIQHFIPSGGGRLVHIASRAAYRGDTKDYAAYAASKGGIVSLNATIARAYGKNGVTSFVIAPGWTLTEMAQSYIDTHGDEAVLNEIALGSLTTPEDIAPMVALLASGLADHATGTSIDFNAGSYVH
jgi:NAD(P)-dependent dehydrogenase (short-subunit alcohol dehydrogenase family)